MGGSSILTNGMCIWAVLAGSWTGLTMGRLLGLIRVVLGMSLGQGRNRAYICQQDTGMILRGRACLSGATPAVFDSQMKQKMVTMDIIKNSRDSVLNPVMITMILISILGLVTGFLAGRHLRFRTRNYGVTRRMYLTLERQEIDRRIELALEHQDYETAMILHRKRERLDRRLKRLEKRRKL